MLQDDSSGCGSEGGGWEGDSERTALDLCVHSRRSDIEPSAHAACVTPSEPKSAKVARPHRDRFTERDWTLERVFESREEFERWHDANKQTFNQNQRTGYTTYYRCKHFRYGCNFQYKVSVDREHKKLLTLRASGTHSNHRPIKLRRPAPQTSSIEQAVPKKFLADAHRARCAPQLDIAATDGDAAHVAQSSAALQCRLQSPSPLTNDLPAAEASHKSRLVPVVAKEMRSRAWTFIATFGQQSDFEKFRQSHMRDLNQNMTKDGLTYYRCKTYRRGCCFQMKAVCRGTELKLYSSGLHNHLPTDDDTRSQLLSTFKQLIEVSAVPLNDAQIYELLQTILPQPQEATG